MPQFVGPIFSWIGSAATSIFGGGAAAGAAGGVGSAGLTGAGVGGAMAGAVGVGATVMAGAASGAALWGTIGNAVLQLAVSTAINVALKPNMAAGSGAPLDFKNDPSAPVPLVIGRTATGGSAVFAEVFGGDKAKFLGFAVVLSLGPGVTIESFSANKQAVTFSGGNAVGYYNNIMFQSQKAGTESDTAHVYSLGPWSPTLSGVWTTDHKLPGLASVLWTLKSAEVKYSTGAPDPLWVVIGPAVYDPREDSTYPGGSGSQRWNDQTTWSTTGNDNPYLQGLTWAIGRRLNGKLVMGCGIPIAGIDVAAFVEGANVAEANGWTCGGVVYSSEAKWTVLESLLRAGGGKPLRLGGQLSCMVSTPRVSIATLTGADLTGEAQIGSRAGRAETFNAVRFRYREETLNWEFVQADLVQAEDFVTEDGRLRVREVDYPLVGDKDQGAQLAVYDIWNAREEGPHTVRPLPRWMGLKPGDCVTIDWPEEEISLKALIYKRHREPTTGGRTLTLMTETDDKHDAALGATGTVPTPGDYEEIDPGDIAPPGSGVYTATGTNVLAVYP